MLVLVLCSRTAKATQWFVIKDSLCFTLSIFINAFSAAAAALPIKVGWLVWFFSLSTVLTLLVH